jgi:uncharacterized protein (DUF486 family)
MNDKTYAMVLLLAASILYTFASFFHLSFVNEKWSITKALMIAMPIVFLEYNCSLRGIKLAHDNGFTSNQIFIIIICMCFVCLFVLNKLVLGDQTTKYDIIAFILLMMAFILSYPDILESLTKN